MTLRIGVVVEDRPDFDTGTTLADRVVLAKVSWLEPELLDHVRRYCGLSDETGYARWTDAAFQRSAFGKNRFGAQAGHFRSASGVSEPAAADALATRRALIQMKLRGVEVALLLRDEDRCNDRGKGMQQARTEEEEHDRPLTVIIGVARSKRECWVLCGFDPRDDIERDSLQAERQFLGFDPREQAERLTAKHDHDKLSAKRVLSVLTKDNRSREVACWEQTDINSLRSRGNNSGLASYLDEVEQRLIPLIAMNPPA